MRGSLLPAVLVVLSGLVALTLAVEPFGPRRSEEVWIPAGAGAPSDSAIWLMNVQGLYTSANAQEPGRQEGRLNERRATGADPQFSRILIKPQKESRFEGTGRPGDLVELRISDRRVATVEVDATGRWRITTGALEKGDYTVEVSPPRPNGPRWQGDEVRIAVPERTNGDDIVAYEGTPRRQPAAPPRSQAENDSAGQAEPERDAASEEALRRRAERLAEAASREFDVFTGEAEDDDAKGRPDGRDGGSRTAQTGIGDDAPERARENSGGVLAPVRRWFERSADDYRRHVIPELARRGGTAGDLAPRADVPPPDRRSAPDAAVDFGSLAGKARDLLREANRRYQDTVIRDLSAPRPDSDRVAAPERPSVAPQEEDARRTAGRDQAGDRPEPPESSDGGVREDEAQRKLDELLRQREALRREAEAEPAREAEAARLAAEREAAERRAAEEREAARIEAERLEAERLAAERLEAERREAERLAAEQAEAEARRLEEAAELARQERERAQRLETERLERERLERLAIERREAERLAALKNRELDAKADRIAEVARLLDDLRSPISRRSPSETALAPEDTDRKAERAREVAGLLDTVRKEEERRARANEDAGISIVPLREAEGDTAPADDPASDTAAAKRDKTDDRRGRLIDLARKRARDVFATPSQSSRSSTETGPPADTPAAQTSPDSAPDSANTPPLPVARRRAPVEIAQRRGPRSEPATEQTGRTSAFPEEPEGDDSSGNAPAEDRAYEAAPFGPGSKWRGRTAGWHRAIGDFGGTGCGDQRAGRTISPPGTYVVARGDTLWTISFRHYDEGTRYPRILRANRRKIRNPHRIYPCQKVWLPRR